MTSSTDDGRDANVGAFEQGLALAVQRGSRIERAIDETLFDQFGPRRFDVAASTQAYDNLLSSLGGGSGPEEFVLATINHDRSLELAMSGLAYQSGTGFVHDGVHLSIAMTALAEHEDVRIVLRVGDGRLANETRSLFKLGVVRDVHRIAAGLIAAQAVGSDATGVLCRDADAHLVHPDGRLERSAISASA